MASRESHRRDVARGGDAAGDLRAKDTVYHVQLTCPGEYCCTSIRDDVLPSQCEWSKMHPARRSASPVRNTSGEYFDNVQLVCPEEAI
ncbi:hypothetical protein CYMTET_42175 [Cymbomonas tetramitiformis]|uniref:Uncharacterized protein n=1 Tax=Cymbomonas tetramitiformis TaxID=36881 RepID=A0AAE0C4L1_9CHLO|nr:hypothetical protein CYMTET_42175 [Cymbomonas tetramitiformis]